jgi:hypothetical protein
LIVNNFYFSKNILFRYKDIEKYTKSDDKFIQMRLKHKLNKIKCKLKLIKCLLKIFINKDFKTLKKIQHKILKIYYAVIMKII